MNKLFIIGKNIYDFNNYKFNIGGVQTYVRDLAFLAKKLNKDVYIVQLGNDNFSKKSEGINIFQFNLNYLFFQNPYQKLFNYICRNLANVKKDIIIISTDQLDVRSKLDNVISIQHGVAFDIPGDLLNGIWNKLFILQILNKLFRSLKNISRFSNVKNVVCVDYNFFNWYRTIGTISNSMSLKVIPNYSSSIIHKHNVLKKLNSRTKKKFLFARRFVDYRGVFLFSNVILKLLNEFHELEVTFAGDGPLKNYLIRKFEGYDNVAITSFEAKDSVDFHFSFDVAVIPTVFSEGTSLSLNEAMAAGCFPIATHVGGMTNMIIDGFNGRLVYPSESELYLVLKEVILMNDIEFNQIVENAYEVVNSSFSKDIWSLKWKDLINKISNKNG